jgi:hypothetical protein
MIVRKQRVQRRLSDSLLVYCSCFFSAKTVFRYLKMHSCHFDVFQEALKVVQPSAKREGFATVPDVTWEDVGALEGVREELSYAILVCVADNIVICPNACHSFNFLLGILFSVGRFSQLPLFRTLDMWPPQY